MSSPLRGATLCTVSTVRDTPTNVEHFVTANLRAGVDHMFVFLDGEPDVEGREVERFLSDHPHVTVVRCDSRYWRGRAPGDLVERQLVNANLVNWLLSAVEPVPWLAHIDGDECLEIDKDVLLGLPPTVETVRLAVLEAVSTEHGSRDVGLFKKKLMAEELQPLVDRGLLEEPHNRFYLRGHVTGKVVVRPSLQLGMGIHRATRRGGEELAPYRGPGFRLLHYDCVSADEFVRKWSTHVEGGATRFRAERNRVRVAVKSVLADAALGPDGRAEQLRRIYKEHVEDDVEELGRLGVLVEPRPFRHQHEPAPFPPATADELRELLTRLLDVDKGRFSQWAAADESLAVMREVSRALRRRRRATAARIRAAVERAEAVVTEACAAAGQPGRDGFPLLPWVPPEPTLEPRTDQ